MPGKYSLPIEIPVSLPWDVNILHEKERPLPADARISDVRLLSPVREAIDGCIEHHRYDVRTRRTAERDRHDSTA
jgi:hypothetical protein